MNRLLAILAVCTLAAPAYSQCMLKQSTASQEISIGPFFDSTDGDTEETALTIANTDVRLKKGSADWAAKNSGGATAEEKGNYRITLDATDTATVGILEINVHVSGALGVWKTCYVLVGAVYDELYGSSAVGYVANAPVNVAQFGGSNGTFASGRAEVNTTHFGGSAGSFLSGRPSVNINTNNDKTGYTVSTNSDKTGYTVSTNQDKTGYAISTNGDKTGYTVSTNQDKTGYGLSSSERTTTADVILDRASGADETMRQAMRLIAAALGGKTSGSGTSTLTFRDPSDTKNVIVCTVSSGNRTACTLDLN